MLASMSRKPLNDHAVKMGYWPWAIGGIKDVGREAVKRL